MGTPKTLHEAICNGLEEALEHQKNFPVLSTDILAKVIKRHVVDYLAQAFNVAMFGSTDDAEEERLLGLFEKISERNKTA